VLAAVLHGREDLRVEEVPRPTISTDEVLLRCRAAAICGTDKRIYQTGHNRVPAGSKRILGHELAGEVIEVGRGVPHIKEGMRAAVAPNFGCGSCAVCARGWHHLCPEYGAIGLTVDGGFAEYVRIPSIALQQGCLIEMPEGLSFAEGALNEPLACVYNGYVRCPTKVGDTVLIVGTGPVGMMLIQVLRLGGGRPIIVANRSDSRFGLALELGADHTIDYSRQDLVRSVMELTDESGADVVFIACPSAQIQETVLDLAALHGRINFFSGLPEGEGVISFNSNAVHYKELVVTGSHGCCTYHCREALKLQESHSVNQKPLISNVFPLGQAEEAMAAALTRKGLKTIIEP